MSLETLQCAAVAAATIIIEHKKKRCRKRWMANFLEREEPEYKHTWRSQNGLVVLSLETLQASDFELLLQLIGQSINTFAASYLNTQGLNNSCLKSRQRRP